jgi:hypothetical protein
VDEAKYRLLIQQLVLCNDEIERLQKVESKLLTENENLKHKVALQTKELMSGILFISGGGSREKYKP